MNPSLTLRGENCNHSIDGERQRSGNLIDSKQVLPMGGTQTIVTPVRQAGNILLPPLFIQFCETQVGSSCINTCIEVKL